VNGFIPGSIIYPINDLPVVDPDKDAFWPLYPVFFRHVEVLITRQHPY
jgi:hypothetical protein